MTFRGKLLHIIIIPIIIYLSAIIIFSWLHYRSLQEDFNRDIDAKLLKSCRMADSLYLSSFHLSVQNDSSPQRTGDSINKQLNTLTQLMDVEYIYSFIYSNDSVLFSASSYTIDDSSDNIISHYGDYYEGATPALKKLFLHPDTLFEEAEDSWGHFKSGLIARHLPNGDIYVVGTDININYLKAAQRSNIRNTFSILVFLIIIFVPFAYLLFRIVYREKRVLDFIIKERTSSLQNALNSNEQLNKQVSIQNRFITNILNSFQELILVVNKEKVIEGIYGQKIENSEWIHQIEIGSSIKESFPQSIADELYARIVAWEADTAYNFELLGDDKWYSIEFLPLIDEEFRLIILKASDITEKKIESLKVAQFQQVIESSASSIVITKSDGTIEYVNPAFENLTGYSREEALGANPRILQSGYISDSYFNNMWDILRSGKTWKGEFLNRKKNGTLFWERALISPIFDKHGELIQYVALKEDITEQLEAQKEIEQTKTVLQTILENSKEAIVLVSENFDIQYYNKNFADFTQNYYQRSLVLSENLSSLNHYFEEIKSRFFNEVKNGKKEFSEIYSPENSESEQYFNIEVRAVNAGYGKRMLIVEIRDISKSYVAEEYLRQSEMKFRQLFDAGSLPIAVFDRDTRQIVDINQTAEIFYKIDKKDVIGKPFEVVNYFKDKKVALYIKDELDKHGKVENYEAELADAFYPGGWIVVNAFEGQYKDQRLSYLVATDITHVKQVEKAIKMKAGFEELINVFTTELLIESDSDFDNRLKLLMEKICNYLDVERGYIYFFNQNEHSFTGFYQWIAEEKNEVSSHLKIASIRDFPFWFNKIVMGESIITNDIELLNEEAKYEKEYFRSLGIHKIAGVPIMKGSNVIGFIGLDSSKATPWIAGIGKMLKIIGELFINAQMFADYRERLKSAVIKADEATRQKSLFLARMSHELRTPLNGILASIELMKGTALSDEASEYANIIQSAGEILLTVISDILDYSKIEARQIQLENLPFDIAHEMHALVRLFESKAKENGVLMIFKVDQSVSKQYLGDVVRIKQIIGNLLSNAVKFTQTGSIELSIMEISGIVEFRVIDTGIGIPTEVREKLFSSYVQAGSDTYRKYGGTGLGLSIALLLTEMMEGSIRITDNPMGQGTCFIIQLPLKKVSEEKRNVGLNVDLRPEQKGFDFSKVKILLAEDNFTNQKIAKIVFQKQGVDIVVVNDGKEAVEKLKQEFFDVVLMDIQMPIMDGVEATALINEYFSDKIAKPVIIAMTADSSGSKADDFILQGFADYIPKPFKIQDIVDSFQRCFKSM